MAKLFPSIENIKKLKVKPTEGEFFLLLYLEEHLPYDYEIFFQPFLNGDMPDIILMRQGGGVAIIEVKDWKLTAYSVDENNKWHEGRNNYSIKSPHQQVFRYKSNMFNLHINGLAEKNVMNRSFFGVIKPFVYFHGSTKEDINNLYLQSESKNKQKIKELNDKFKNKSIEFERYEKSWSYSQNKLNQIRRDKGIILYESNLSKILICLEKDHILFTNDIFNEFKRYLKPPYHVAQQGIDIKYDKKQQRLIKSKIGFQKIKGVAGSGKTTILAKRAVNAHKRHSERVLILTYNKTLRNYIRDKISEVKEDFSWGKFDITNYHSFITQALNATAIEISPPEDYNKVSDYFDKLYSNEKLFDNHIIKNKYKTILIDEIQDYEPSWIKIIREYFLTDDGEMVLFGDEAQNIYERDISKNKSAIVQGFGRWERLNRSFRSKSNSPILSLSKKFQELYLIEKYDTEVVAIEPLQGLLSFDIMEAHSFSNAGDIENIISVIFHHLKESKIHPNDLCIVSSKIELLRKLDHYIRLTMNEKTDTTFETQEVFLELDKKYQNKSVLQKELEEIRSSKKFAFNLNSGLMKLSTVHSYKGLEASTSVYLLMEGDNEEMVYTGITRGKHNFIVFLQEGNKYMDFFEETMKVKKSEKELVF